MTTVHRLTLDEFLRLPETKPASEFADGEVMQKPMPTEVHALLQVFFAVSIYGFLRAARLGRVASELRCVFGPAGCERPYVPDVVFISGARLTSGDARKRGAFRGAPDLAIEIVSPGQSVSWFDEKVAFYLAHGVRLVWIVDPYREVVRVRAPHRDPFTLRTGDTLDGGDVLPGFTLALSEVWAEVQV